MGVTRKTMSLFSMGLIDFRSDKERIARSTRRTGRAVKHQTSVIKAQGRKDRRRQGPGYILPAPPARPAAPPPGWYPDPTLGYGLRWWDGFRWTEHHQG